MIETATEYMIFLKAWLPVIIIVLLLIRIFPEIKQYGPELWRVSRGQKNLSDVFVKEGELMHFDHKNAYVARPVINEGDCITFHARLMSKVERSRTAGEPVTFSLVGIEKLTSPGEKAFLRFVSTICKRNNASVILVFPKQGKNKTMDVLFAEAWKAKDSNCAELVEIRRDKRDHSTEQSK